MRNIVLVPEGAPGWHYGDRVKIKPEGGMREFWGQTGVVVGAEGEYLRIELDEPVVVDSVGIVKDDLWMPYTVRKIRDKKGSRDYPGSN